MAASVGRAGGGVPAPGRFRPTATVPPPPIPDAWREEVCYLFAELHEERFGDVPDTGSGISRETCSNPAGWPELAVPSNT
jgi:hypothetical protein